MCLINDLLCSYCNEKIESPSLFLAAAIILQSQKQQYGGNQAYIH